MIVRWSKRAQSELQLAYDYIKLDSSQNAEKVKDKLISRTETLAAFPEIYPLDKYKINNRGQYRAFVLYHYRISYKVMKNAVLIVRLRHTSMSPLSY